MTDSRDHHASSGYTPYQGTNSHGSVRHARENAIDEVLFERLFDATYDLKPDRDLESRLILVALGRLGLRVGELCHLERDWIDFNTQRITIPYQHPCDHGRNGGLCGECRAYAKQRAEKNDGLTLEEAQELQWLAKTEHAARSVPYGWSPRIQFIIETYFEKYPRWMYSRSAVERRLEWLIEGVPEAEGLHPHALRATAASHQVGRGLGVISLKQFMGWSQLETAMIYHDHNPDKLDREISFLNR